MKPVGYIYLVTNTVNGKKYIGQTKSVHLRWTKHLWDARNGSPLALHNAIRKYGADNFTIECLEEIVGSHADLVSAEILHIAHYSCVAPKGYNLTSGGEGVDYSVPGVLERATLAARLRAKDPAWLKANRENNQRLAQDPEWQKANLEGARRRSANSDWRAHQIDGAKKRSENPDWMSKQGEIRRLANGAKTVAALNKDALCSPEEARKRVQQREAVRRYRAKKGACMMEDVG